MFISFYYLPNLYLSHSPQKYIDQLYNDLPNQIIDRNGKLLAELFSTKLSNIKIEEIPKGMRNMIIFIEDKNFYEHGGIDFSSIVRAVLANFLSLGYRQGGSTITQQLARLLLLEKQKTLTRKFREASLAYALERKLTKNEILTAYLNYVYLGHGAYGIANASQFYFQKNIRELNFAQRLVLASLPSAPERYSPISNPHVLKLKMGALIQRMQKEGFAIPSSYIEERYTLFQNINRSPSENVYHERINHAPYISDYIRQKIYGILGKEYIYNAGLKIQTTININLQQASIKESQIFIKRVAPHFPPVLYKKNQVITKNKKEKLVNEIQNFGMGLMTMGLSLKDDKTPRLQVAVIGIENKSGQILFLQGGSKFGSNNQLNRAINMYRQTGSTIKSIFYSLAIESGAINSATLLDDKPIFMYRGKNNYWTPQNYGGVYEGSIPVRTALSHSKNLPAIQVLNLLGRNETYKGMQGFFFPDPEIMEKRFRSDDSIAIGSLEMSPLEMALAYSAFGNNGYIHRPSLILSIKDSYGKVLYESEEKDEFNLKVPPKRKVISGDTAQIIVNLLAGASTRGGVARGGYKYRNFIGKTGTSNDHRDAWFIGLTPEVTTAVWVGFDRPSFSMRGGTGSNLAGPLWGQIMRYLSSSNKSFSFSPRAKTVKICAATGKIFSPACQEQGKRELFRRNDNLKKLLPKQEKRLVEEDRPKPDINKKRRHEKNKNLEPLYNISDL